ncbi:cystathionine beta-lyase [Ferrovibrio xuzhouensis]|uniref:Cystathionine beta-lyase n=1 Tax=Ferrovibrio xuzhouensis TaxID=1576914 RepID=A0ABV7VNT5_9PROT
MRTDTVLVHLGRDDEQFSGLVNAPVCRASTILFPTIAALKAAQRDKQKNLYYGRFGTQTVKLLQSACRELDGGYEAMLFPSGLAAIARVLGSLLRPGDHLLMVDSVYGPVRDFCENELRDLGVSTSFYAPEAADELGAAIRKETKVIFCESPGTMTFELQDIDKVVAAAAAAGVVTVIDNTWATPYFFRPLQHGVDIVIQSASKYMVGHSDAMLGVAVTNERCWPLLQRSSAAYGNSVSPDDCYLALRGMRTLGVRLDRHFASALKVARWLESQPEVRAVHYPALESSPDHAQWKRHFTGASGLFAVEFPASVGEQAAEAFADSLELFGIGVSWGGFESLAIPAHFRRNHASRVKGPVVRLHIGLEDPDDLIEDLSRALKECIAAAMAHV